MIFFHFEVISDQDVKLQQIEWKVNWKELSFEIICSWLCEMSCINMTCTFSPAKFQHECFKHYVCFYRFVLWILFATTFTFATGSACKSFHFIISAWLESTFVAFILFSFSTKICRETNTNIKLTSWNYYYWRAFCSTKTLETSFMSFVHLWNII